MLEGWFLAPHELANYGEKFLDSLMWRQVSQSFQFLKVLPGSRDKRHAVTQPFLAREVFTFIVYILFSDDLLYTLCKMLTIFIRKSPLVINKHTLTLQPFFIGVIGGRGQISSFRNMWRTCKGTCEGSVRNLWGSKLFFFLNSRISGLLTGVRRRWAPPLT